MSDFDDGLTARERAEAALRKNAKLKVAKKDEGNTGYERAGRYLAGFLAISTALVGGLQMYEALFPPWPSHLPVASSDALHAALFGGEPAIVLCRNISTVDTAGQTAAKAASALGIRSYIADCDTVLPSGRTLFQALSFEQAWNPAWGVVSNGKHKPTQLSPSLLYKHEELAEKVKPLIKAPRHTRIDGDRDLDGCLRDKVGGCLLVYSSKDKEVLAEELPPIAEGVRNVTVASLNSGKLMLKSKNEGLTEAVKAAVSAARAVSSGGAAKGAVLVSLRRIAPSLVAGDTGRLLVTVEAAGGIVVTEADARRVLGRAAQAYSLLKAGSTSSSGPVAGGDGAAGSGSVEGQEGQAKAALADDSIEALLARDEELSKLGAVLVSRSEISIGNAPVKAAPTPAPSTAGSGSSSKGRASSGSSSTGKGSSSGGDDTMTAEERRERRAAARASRDKGRSKGTEGAAAEEEEGEAEAAAAARRKQQEEEEERLTPEQRAELLAQRQREIRQRMAQEEAESGHFAAAAGDVDEEDGQGEGEEGQVHGTGQEEAGQGRGGSRATGRQEQWEEVDSEDLDEVQADDEEL